MRESGLGTDLCSQSAVTTSFTAFFTEFRRVPSSSPRDGLEAIGRVCLEEH